MNVTHLTYDYNIYYINKGEYLDNILDMEYEVIAGTINGNYYVEINITYIDVDGCIRHIRCDSKNIKFIKRNESSRPYFAKEKE